MKTINTQQSSLQQPFQVFQVSLNWLSVDKGGRKHIPHTGIYFCTTELLQDEDIASWSIVLKLSQQTPHEAWLWFLFDAQQQVDLGDAFDLMEGARCVGRALVYDILDSTSLSFWYDTCTHCQGQGYLQLCMAERQQRAFLCCDTCYFAYWLSDQIPPEPLNALKTSHHLANLREVQYYRLAEYALNTTIEK